MNENLMAMGVSFDLMAHVAENIAESPLSQIKILVD
jgi:hypothetical protein